MRDGGDRLQGGAVHRAVWAAGADSGTAWSQRVPTPRARCSGLRDSVPPSLQPPGQALPPEDNPGAVGEGKGWAVRAAREQRPTLISSGCQGSPWALSCGSRGLSWVQSQLAALWGMSQGTGDAGKWRRRECGWAGSGGDEGDC